MQSRDIAGYEQFVGIYAAQSIDGYKKEPATTDSGEVKQQNNNITIAADLASRGNIDRVAVTDEKRIKNINSILKGKLSNKGAIFMAASKKYGIDVYRQVAIVCQETGYGADRNSSIYTHNNIGGMNSGGGYFHYKTVDESIYAHAKLLANYKARGLETLTDIKPVYCPDSDPRNKSGPMKGFNEKWLPNTLKIYETLEGMG